MNTRLTIDLKNPKLMKMLHWEAMEKEKKIREVVVEALESYFSVKEENILLTKLAEKSFAEWNNPKDAEYDRL